MFDMIRILRVPDTEGITYVAHSDKDKKVDKAITRTHTHTRQRFFFHFSCDEITHSAGRC